MRTPAITRRRFIAGLTTVTAAAAAGGAAVVTVCAQPSAERASETHDIPRLIPTVCGMCDAQCGLIAYARGDRLEKLEGNRSHTHSFGRICARGSAGVKLLYDPDRLRQPLKRVGEGKFEPVSWEQAFSEIGAALTKIRAEHGPQSLAWVRHPDACDDWDRQFAAAFGTPNLFSCSSLSQGARTIASRATLGWVPVPDFGSMRFVMVFGRNHGESIFPADLYGLMTAKEKGARVVVVDPRVSQTAAQATEWLSIRPGSDGALLLALMHVLVNENLHDQAFVESYVDGFAELREYLSDKTPGWAATETDISQSTIIRLAREMAAARPFAAVDPGCRAPWGSLYANSLNTARAALVLNGLLGAYGNGGTLKRPLAQAEGNGRFTPPATPAITAPRVDGASLEPALLSPGEGRVHALPEAILTGQPYPIKAMVVRHSNPALSWPNTKKVVEALSKLDLLVVVDVLPSDTTMLAHYILPESTYLERADPPVFSRGEPAEVAVRQPVVQPLYDTKSPADIITGLAGAAGLGQYLSFTVDDVAAARIEGLAVDRERLQAFGVWHAEANSQPDSPLFGTPSGKIEIKSDRLGAAGFDTLPEYHPTLVRPQAANEFRLLNGRISYHTGSATQNNAWLHERAKDNPLYINRERALRLDIDDGDMVFVRSEVGELRVRARVTEGIHPHAVFLAHGFGARNPGLHLAAGSGVNDNELIPDRLDAAFASAAVCETIVTVSKSRGK